MDLRAAIVPAIHTLLASGVGILAVIGMFGTGSAGEGTVLVGGAQFAFFVILPMIGIVMLGLYDWQVGRGSGVLRAADVAVFALAALELSVGTTGVVRWLVGGVAVLAASGLASSFLIPAPHRAGFRR
jgi:hypothetical protein